ncbi:MAG: hypothetical protein AB1405_08930, partial [Bdellovibrionota bacterium]
MNGKASGEGMLAGVWRKIARGRSLSEIPEGEMNFYLAVGMTLAHAGVVFFFDLYFHSPLPDRAALSRHVPLLIQVGYGLLVPYLFLLVLCRLQ